MTRLSLEDVKERMADTERRTAAWNLQHYSEYLPPVGTATVVSRILGNPDLFKVAIEHGYDPTWRNWQSCVAQLLTTGAIDLKKQDDQRFVSSALDVKFDMLDIVLAIWNVQKDQHIRELAGVDENYNHVEVDPELITGEFKPWNHENAPEEKREYWTNELDDAIHLLAGVDRIMRMS